MRHLRTIDTNNLQTSHCVKCGKPELDFFCGHVRMGEVKVLAGWCKDCHAEPKSILANLGFVDNWKPEMGLVEWTA